MRRSSLLGEGLDEDVKMLVREAMALGTSKENFKKLIEAKKKTLKNKTTNTNSTS